MASTSGPQNYGRLFWAIKVHESLCSTGHITVNADRIEITENGDLLCIGGSLQMAEDGERQSEWPVLSIARNMWTAFYAANCMDGSPIAVDHWKGECER